MSSMPVWSGIVEPVKSAQPWTPFAARDSDGTPVLRLVVRLPAARLIQDPFDVRDPRGVFYTDDKQ